MSKTRNGARQGNCFKKQKQNQQFSYQKRNKLPDQQVIYEQRYPKNLFDRCFKNKKTKPSVLLANKK